MREFRIFARSTELPYRGHFTNLISLLIYFGRETEGSETRKKKTTLLRIFVDFCPKFFGIFGPPPPPHIFLQPHSELIWIKIIFNDFVRLDKLRWDERKNTLSNFIIIYSGIEGGRKNSPGNLKKKKERKLMELKIKCQCCLQKKGQYLLSAKGDYEGFSKKFAPKLF